MKTLLIFMIFMVSSFSANAAASSYKCKSISHELLKSGTAAGEMSDVTNEFTLTVVQSDQTFDSEDERFGSTRLIDDGRSGPTQIGLTLYEADPNGAVNIQLDELKGVRRSVSRTLDKANAIEESLKFSGSYLLATTQVSNGVGVLAYRSIGSGIFYQIICVKI